MKKYDSLSKAAMSVAVALLLFTNPNRVNAKPAETDWEQIYVTESAKSQSYLGTQCKMETDGQYKAFLKTVKDPELKMPHAEYLKQLQKIGIDPGPYGLAGQQPETKYLCYMTANEYLALSLYTGSYYRQINTALRSLDLQLLKNYRLTIKFLVSALSKIKDYVGVTKRGSTLNNAALSECKANAYFSDRGFLSTSVGSGFGGTHRFVLASASCKYIASFSRYPNEEEVLCMPGTIFQIGWIAKKPAATEIVLVETAQSFDIDRLIQILVDDPDQQNPQLSDVLGQSCQPIINKTNDAGLEDNDDEDK